MARGTRAPIVSGTFSSNAVRSFHASRPGEIAEYGFVFGGALMAEAVRSFFDGAKEVPKREAPKRDGGYFVVENGKNRYVPVAKQAQRKPQ